MFQVSKKDRRELKKREAEILERLGNDQEVRSSPMMNASNVSYELSERAAAAAWGGVAAMYQLARTAGLVVSLANTRAKETAARGAPT